MREPLRWLVLAAAGIVAIAAAAYALLGPKSPPQPVADGTGRWMPALLELSDEEFGRLPEGWRLDLPQDHGAHPGARAETWAISAHLRDDRGEEHGVQLALFRVALGAPDAPQAGSAWVPRELYAGQVALLKEGEERLAIGQRLNRGVLGLAGHQAVRGEVWLDDWSIAFGEGASGDRLTLDAAVGEVELQLVFEPTKEAVASEGDAAPFHGFSITRMSVEGVIGTEGDRRAVTGLAWLDRLWGDVPLPGGPVVWDRLQIQLDDGTDLAVVRSRRRDGGGTPTLDGFVVDAAGAVDGLDGAALEMEPMRTWRPRRGEAPYPLDWRLTGTDLDLQVRPVIDDQLLSFGEPVWSGTVAATGAFRGRPASGIGTLQLTGYNVQ